MNPYGVYPGQDSNTASGGSYYGPSPYAAYQKPSFMGGIGQLINPFAPAPNWGNGMDQDHAAADSISQKPFDAMARIGQRFVAPAIAFGLAQKIMTGSTGLGAGNFMTGGWAGGVGRSFGSRIAMGMGAAEGGMAAGVMGGAGALAGGLVLPYLAGTAVMSAVDHAIFQPYAAARQMSNDFRTNFAGVSFGGGVGDRISGRGFSGASAAGMANQLTSAGINDMMLSSSQMGSIGNMSARAGLLDNVGSAQIVGRIKGIADQIKIIMAISKDPSMQSAIEELSKLKQGGASLVGGMGSVAAGAYRSIGTAASVAGMSIQAIMNQGGAMGSSMYASAGLTSYLGMIAGSNTQAGFMNAARNGLISEAALNRMGGIGGATAGAMSTTLSVIQSPYNRMVQANKYISGRGDAGSVVGNMLNIGAAAAQDPIKLMGDMFLNQGAMDSADAQDGDSISEASLIQQAESWGGKPGSDGKWDPRTLAAVLQRSGRSSAEANAWISKRQSLNSVKGVAGALAGINTSMIASSRAANDQNHSGSDIGSRVYRGGQAVYAWGADNAIWGGANSLVGKINDTVGGWADYMSNGNTYKNKMGGDISKILSGVTGGSGGDMSNLLLIKEANSMINLMASTEGKSEAEVYAANIDKFPNLKGAVSGKGVPEAISTIKSISRKALAGGMVGAASLAKTGSTLAGIQKSLGGNLQQGAYNSEVDSPSALSAQIRGFEEAAKASAAATAGSLVGGASQASISLGNSTITATSVTLITGSVKDSSGKEIMGTWDSIVAWDKGMANKLGFGR